MMEMCSYYKQLPLLEEDNASTPQPFRFVNDSQMYYERLPLTEQDEVSMP